MLGKCRGSGVMAEFTPVIVGSKYGRTSVELLLCVQPSGFIEVTKCGWGVYGSVSGIM